MNEQQLFRDENIKPAGKNIAESIGLAKNAYESFTQELKNHDIQMDWRYYNDGKAWLCKLVYKKKTVVWLSIWDGFFRIGFYFTDKTRDGLMNLDIADKIKHDFTSCKAIGRLLPLVLDISEKEQLGDLLKVVEYKKNLK